MVDQVGGAASSSAADLAKAQQAQRKEPTRSFQDVAKDRGRTDRKDDRDRDAAKERALREGKAGPKPAEADPYAAQLQERLLGGREGSAALVEGEVQGELVQGEQVQGEVIETSQRTDAAFGELRATAGAREEGALTFGRAQVDRSDKSMLQQKHDLGSAESSTRTTQTDVQERDGRTLERDTRDVDETKLGDDDLKSELDRHLFASEISNPLMAQRATEPKAVEAARTTAQISPQVIDKIVERARFGQLQGGGHEFQVDLKQDVFGGAELKVVTKDGQVSVEMVSDDPALHQAARQLGDQLKQKGLNVAEVRVMTKAEAQDALLASRGLGQAGAPRARSLYDDDDDLARRR